MMERNEALLRKVGDVIANEPERYDQCAWIELEDCGTVACIAGHTVLLHPEYEGEARWGAPRIRVAGEECLIENVAEEMLGVDAEESRRLFAGGWRPAGAEDTPLHERVRDALYALADGAAIEDVSA